uniref:Uncharacterized protein n=1 Tax=Arundo donax TaxID=35708 RepID=A0A0A9DAP5_ARUDO
MVCIIQRIPKPYRIKGPTSPKCQWSLSKNTNTLAVSNAEKNSISMHRKRQKNAPRFYTY